MEATFTAKDALEDGGFVEVVTDVEVSAEPEPMPEPASQGGPLTMQELTERAMKPVGRNAPTVINGAPYYTVTQFARIANTWPSVISRMLKKDEYKGCVRVAGRPFVPESYVQEYMQKRLRTWEGA